MSGNPCRYIFDGRFIRRPEANEKKKEVKISGCDLELKDFYETAVIDFYSAPDVIVTYTNGNTCKNEWRRYHRYTYKGLKKKSQETSNYDDYSEVSYRFEYEDSGIEAFDYDNPMLETDIPLGKFANMNYEQVQEYKKQNIYGWEIKKEK